jgi:hypothetical protein
MRTFTVLVLGKASAPSCCPITKIKTATIAAIAEAVEKILFVCIIIRIST